MTRQPKRSARTLAAPFLVTVAMVPACASSTSATPDAPSPAAVNTVEGPTTAPTSGEVPEPTAAPPRPEPPPVNEAELPALTDPSRLQRHPDGTCWQAFPPCEPIISCNPPPPIQVRCPK